MGFDQAAKGRRSLARAALYDGGTRRFQGKGDHAAHLPAIAGFRRQSGVQRPWCPKRLYILACVARLKPAACRFQRLAEPGLQRSEASFPGALGHQPGHFARPQRLAEKREQKLCVLLDRAHIDCVLITITGAERIEARHIGGAVHLQHDRRAVWAQNCRRMRCVAIFEPVLGKLIAQFCLRRSCHEQHECGSHHIMMKPRQRHLFRGHHAAADPILAFDYQDPVALSGEHGGGHQRVDAGADDQMIDV